MNSIDNIIAILREMKKLEDTLSKFYALCSKTFPQTADMWHELELEELRHCEYIDEMLNLINKNPQNFTPKKDFKIQAGGNSVRLEKTSTAPATLSSSTVLCPVVMP